VKYLFIAAEPGHIEVSCSGLIYDLVQAKHDVNVVICRGSGAEAVKASKDFGSLGLTDDKVLVSGLTDSLVALGMFVQRQIDEVEPDFVFVKHPSTYIRSDQTIWRAVLDHESDVSIMAFKGYHHDTDFIIPPRRNVIVELSDQGVMRQLKLGGVGGFVEFEMMRFSMKFY